MPHSLNNLAELYRAMGNYAAAEPLLWQALEIRRTALGEDHPDYATQPEQPGGVVPVDGQLRGGRAPAPAGPARFTARPWGRTTPTMPPA